MVGEGEYVQFAGNCSCEGPVEVWLQNVVDAMQVGTVGDICGSQNEGTSIDSFSEIPHICLLCLLSSRGGLILLLYVWVCENRGALQAALSAEFKRAVPSYDEKPRVKWIFDNSVQNTVVVSRTFFTHEVNEAFADMEDGNEDALKVGVTPSSCRNERLL